MQVKLKTMWSGVRDNPYHIVIALSLIGIGISMIVEPQPFVWPPGLRDIANDHGFDAAFIVVGLMMLLWTASKSHHEEWDAVNLMVAAFLMGTLTIYQLLHMTHTGGFMPWIQDAAILALIVILAVRSDADEVE